MGSIRGSVGGWSTISERFRRSRRVFRLLRPPTLTRALLVLDWPYLGCPIRRYKSGTQRSRKECRERHFCACGFVQCHQRVGWSTGTIFLLLRLRGLISNASCLLQSAERIKTPGAFVVTTSRDKSIMLWDASTGQHLRTFVCGLCVPILFSSLLHRLATMTGFDVWSFIQMGNI